MIDEAAEVERRVKAITDEWLVTSGIATILVRLEGLTRQAGAMAAETLDPARSMTGGGGEATDPARSGSRRAANLAQKEESMTRRYLLRAIQELHAVRQTGPAHQVTAPTPKEPAATSQGAPGVVPAAAPTMTSFPTPRRRPPIAEQTKSREADEVARQRISVPERSEFKKNRGWQEHHPPRPGLIGRRARGDDQWPSEPAGVDRPSAPLV